MIQEIAPGRIDSDAVEPGETSGSEPQPRLTDGGVLRAAAARYAGTLDKTLRSAVIPYGYTVTVWASGAYLISLRGLPSGLEAFAFVVGATLAFGVLASMSQRRPKPIEEPTIAPISRKVGTGEIAPTGCIRRVTRRASDERSAIATAGSGELWLEARSHSSEA